MVWNTYSPEDQAWIAAGKSGKNWGAFLKKTLIALPPYTLKAEQPLAFSF